MTAIFGPSIDSSDVERAVQSHLEAWMPTQIAEILRVKDPLETRWTHTSIPAIRSYRVSHLATPQKWPEDQLPTIVIGSFGEVRAPRLEEEGRVVAWYSATVLCIAQGRDEEDSKELSRLYAGAVREAIMQHRDLSGFSNGVTMGPESNSPVTKGVEAERSLHGCARPYVVEVENVLDLDEGPNLPLPDPFDPPEAWPVGKTTSIEVRSGQDAVDELRDNGHFD